MTNPPTPDSERAMSTLAGRIEGIIELWNTDAIKTEEEAARAIIREVANHIRWRFYPDTDVNGQRNKGRLDVFNFLREEARSAAQAGGESDEHAD